MSTEQYNVQSNKPITMARNRVKMRFLAIILFQSIIKGDQKGNIKVTKKGM